MGLSVTSVFLVALIVGNYFCSRYNEVITTMLCGSGTDFSSEDTKLTLENNDQAVQKIAEDGMVLLKNKCLPLDKSVTKINLFGWSSIDSAFFLSGGGSSTATINEEKKITLKIFLTLRLLLFLALEVKVLISLLLKQNIQVERIMIVTIWNYQLKKNH